MKIFPTLLLTLLVSLTTLAQGINGQWNGLLKVQGTQLRVVFNIKQTENGLSATLDSPDQGAKGIPTTASSFENGVLKIAIANLTVEYEGTLGSDNIIVGTFKQAGQTFPMNLSKEKVEKEKIVRPQEPAKPYPYYSEDVTFENKSAGISLAGTLTLPKKEGIFPVVILISGSGPQNRDEELMGHKPFLVLSDHLTKNGIAVLRYDDRGTALSKGDFKTATSADFATDVEAAMAYLKTRKEINKKKIGLIGHSEGGLIAPMVASRSKDVSFIVLLAGPGIPGDSILL
ncbi:MAG: alpha/beta hydrolase, partial [Cyclobacteriaceae bacterium]|nr:alpha/beta hydrolase [Cyclobacteriaceae bacterium]